MFNTLKLLLYLFRINVQSKLVNSGMVSNIRSANSHVSLLKETTDRVRSATPVLLYLSLTDPILFTDQ